MSVRKQRFATRNTNAISFTKTATKLGPVSNAITILVMVCLIGLVYLTQVTKTNSFSYDINTLQERQSVLKEQQKDLELTSARLRSVDSSSVSRAADRLVSVEPSGTITN